MIESDSTQESESGLVKDNVLPGVFSFTFYLPPAGLDLEGQFLLART